MERDKGIWGFGDLGIWEFAGADFFADGVG